jgi:hypothetical protein
MRGGSVSLSTPDDDEPLEEKFPDRLPRYAAGPPRPVRERLYTGEPRHRPDRQFQWAPLLAAAGAGFLMAIFFGPCAKTDPRREEEFTGLQSELQGARDRIGQLESELAATQGGVGEAGAAEQRAAEPAAEPEPQPPAKKADRSEPTPEPRREEPIAKPSAATPNREAANESPPPRQAETDQVALAEPQGVISLYEIPDRTAPIVRSSSRSGTSGAPVLQVLAPERAGWTTEAQPTLYWHASKGMPSAGQFTLVREGEEEPVVRGRLAAPDGAGIQRIELSKADVSLEEGTSYRWTVSFGDPAHPESDRAVGGIRRVARPEKITGAASVSERLDALERAGLWYDALDLVTRTIEDNSGAKNLVERRNAMLARVGIHLSSS